VYPLDYASATFVGGGQRQSSNGTGYQFTAKALGCWQ
jgi:hypothetical protein